VRRTAPHPGGLRPKSNSKSKIVEPFYFGAPGRELFGIYHPAAGEPRAEGVVLCPPLFGEQLRTHASLRRLALTLAAAGRHVLRFDYWGTGDSGGELIATTPDSWQQDIGAAVDELIALSGVRRVRLVGVRLGATLAARAAPDLAAVDRLVLWDPIRNGAEYLAQLRHTHQRLLKAHPATRAPQAPAPGTDELVGFRVTPSLVASLERVSLPPWEALLGRPGLSAAVVLSGNDFEHDGVSAAGSASRISMTRVDFDCNWSTYAEAVLYPQEIVNALADEVA
jgi:pimeloyl-ACP methyl ester carboxylesterase